MNMKNFLKNTGKFIYKNMFSKEFLNKKKINEPKNIIKEKESEEDFIRDAEIFKSKENFERSCYHEAGHFVCASLHNIGITETFISADGSFVALDIDGRDSEDDLYKLISIMYGGILAEKIIFGNGSSGFMGADDADMESANEMLRELVILSDDSLSLTGLEKDIIERKMIELSKKIEKETRELLISNKDMLVKRAEEFMKENQNLLKIEF